MGFVHMTNYHYCRVIEELLQVSLPTLSLLELCVGKGRGQLSSLRGHESIVHGVWESRGNLQDLQHNRRWHIAV